jgi:hypothetical protein
MPSDLHNKTRPANDADPTLNTLGYWTDHGATYYYSFDPNLGYAGTLLAVANSFKQQSIGFLGEAGKFVSLGKKRISQLSDNGSVQATIAFANSETFLTMRGYSPTIPNFTASDGITGSVTYNSATGLFSFAVSPGSDGSAIITIAQS